ncbi:hypothetical protein OROMI_000854 [Orobanche minor]
MSSQSSRLSGRRRRGVPSGSHQRTTKQAKTRQRLFKEVVEVSIEDTDAIPARVQAWMQLYKEEGKRDAARAELCNFILEAYGMDFSAISKCKEELTMWYPLSDISILYYDVDEAETDIISLIGSIGMRDYTTMLRAFPNLKNNIITFWDCFINQSQSELFFLDTLNECMKYSITLSCHLPRGYNEIPIMMALQTMSSLVFIAKAQCDEGMKSGSDFGVLERKMTEFFQGFFLWICNNEEEEIRLSCHKELQRWTNTYPTIFLKPPYQKCLQDLASGIASKTTSDSVALVSSSSPGLMTSVEFSYEELSKATNGFSNEIEQNEFGSVWSADFQGEKAAIKRMDIQAINQMGVEARKKFIAELKVLAHVHHLNLVSLKGYCVKGSLYLVYEHIENGNLSQHLCGSSGFDVLPWPTRIQIALDSARGVQYIHEHAATAHNIHHDIKSANILIDKNFRAKVADLGLAKLSQYGRPRLMTRLLGTTGYMPPDRYVQFAQVSPKVDVYAFGVVLFELISAKVAVEETTEYVSKQGGLVASFETVLSQPEPRENLAKLVDHRLSNNDYSLDSVYKMAQLAKACTQKNPQLRPSVSSVVAELLTIVIN